MLEVTPERRATNTWQGERLAEPTMLMLPRSERSSQPFESGLGISYRQSEYHSFMLAYI